MAALDRDAFVAHFGGVFEHSPWIAEAAYDAGIPEGTETAEALHKLMAAALAKGTEAQKRALIIAHPDLAGRLAAAGRLTAESSREQASAGLDLLSDAERQRFTGLNERYKARFAMPFIMAVKGRSKDEILDAFQARLENDPAAEFAAALKQIERIALLRLKDMLP
ncbi:2-oxo-4-hydroxy-4-carboxy-5-ureidoimidazoline decarboxylase [Pelagibius litoralis]|uniref:2-oxo-4-hydroxy-4-carboxy-5-ureidoimidazoline decarboxylase n=1 Tax=Pelagibius litoralis TaxID=374515 RepID=A0A967C4T5_9PROT|nr:2-oxo-4-hydroxy-4-carboxy-5-ureidoimidazoline decarboxylase [Pelagibius litoralis]